MPGIGIGIGTGLFKGGGIYPSEILDGNTVKMFDYEIGTTIATGVSEWDNVPGIPGIIPGGLLQASTSLQPELTADGVLCSGTDMMKTAPFALEQPETIYLIFRAISWTSIDYLIDGNAQGSGGLSQRAPNPGILATAGANSGVISTLPLGEWGIGIMTFNGVNSEWRINDGTPVVGGFGNLDMGGFTIGASGADNFRSNVEFKEIIIRKAADSEPVKTSIYNYLKKKLTQYNDMYIAKGVTIGANVDIYKARNLINALPYYEKTLYPSQAPELTPDDKLISIGWADFFDPEDAQIMIALGTKYNFQQSFYRQITPKTDDYLNEFKYDRDELKMIENQGSHDGKHGYAHIAMLFSYPHYDGRTTPSNDDIRVIRIDGTNGFGEDVTLTVDESLTSTYRNSWLRLSAELGATAWEDLTDSDCDAFRKSLGVFGMPIDGQSQQKVLEGMDILSARYCGTTGESVYDDYTTRTPNTVDGLAVSDGNRIVGGIFQGSATTENHEIWERIMEIVEGYKIEFEGKLFDTRFITTPGGTNRDLFYLEVNPLDAFQRFHDRDYTELATGSVPLHSSILNTDRSFQDVLISAGITHTALTAGMGYADYSYDRISRMESQRLYQRNLTHKKQDNVGDGFKDALRQWQSLYSAVDVDNAIASSDVEKYLYDLTKTDPRFSSLTAYQGGSFSAFIDEAIKFIAWGVSPPSIGDSGAGGITQLRSSMALGHEALMRFCVRAGIKIVSHEQAYEVAVMDYNPVNYFPNFSLVTTQLTVLTSVNAPVYPDGWNGGEVVDDSGTAYHVNSDGTVFIRQYAIKPGDFSISFSGKGTATLNIRKSINKQNLDITTGASFTIIKTIELDSVGYDLYSDTFTIDDVALETYSTPTTPQEVAYQNYMKRYGNKIIGIQIELVVSGGDEIYIKSPVITKL